MCVCVSEWVSDWVGGCVRVIGFEWVSKWVSEWVSEWVCGCESVRGCVRVGEWLREFSRSDWTLFSTEGYSHTADINEQYSVPKCNYTLLILINIIQYWRVITHTLLITFFFEINPKVLITWDHIETMQPHPQIHTHTHTLAGRFESGPGEKLQFE